MASEKLSELSDITGGLRDLIGNNFDIEKMFDQNGELDLETFLSMTSPYGSKERALSNNLYGINHQDIKGMLPINKDQNGLTFFTRPMLNLSAANLRRVPKLKSLLTKDQNSIHRYVRCMLDPRIHTNIYKVTDLPKRVQEDLTLIKNDTSVQKLMDGYIEDNINITSPLVDEKLPFIPVLGNTLKSLSGWPDPVISSYTSKEGRLREQWSMADGTLEYYSAFNIDCTFQNIKDEPIILLFDTWLRYMAAVHEGMMAPYLDIEVEGEIDYNTRIYRLILDETKLFVKKIAATGAAFPVTVPYGKIFDYTDDKIYNLSNSEFNITFSCVGAEYNDYRLIHEFNQTNAIFNLEYRNMLKNEATTLREIPFPLLPIFNYRGYPYIDYDTHQLRWFIDSNSLDFNNIMLYLQKATSTK